MKIKLTDIVRVKLTDHGRAVHLVTFERIQQHPEHQVRYTPPAIDSEGCSTFQLDQLMFQFGRSVGYSSKECFEKNELQIQVPKHLIQADTRNKTRSIREKIITVFNPAYVCTFQSVNHYLAAAKSYLLREEFTTDDLQAAPASQPAQEQESNRNWDEDYRDGENEYECICSFCGNHFMGHKHRPFCKLCASNPQNVPETLEFWKRRALTAESAFEGAMRMIGAENGQAFMGEPVLSKAKPARHADDIAIDKFAAAMKAKMAKQREKGYSGWDDKTVCSEERLQGLLLGHVAKGDPVDVGNFAMMLFNRGEQTQFPIEFQPVQQGAESNNAAVAAIAYALETDCPMEFLNCWNEGNFSEIRKEWPDAPDEVFIGADPLYRQRVPLTSELGGKS